MAKQVTSRFVLKGDNRLNSAFGKAQQQLGDLAKKSALFSAAMVAGATAIVRAQSQNIDALAKTADVVGVGIESLQEYRHAAELAGISNKGIDDSLKRLSRRAGEFANSGGGPAAKAFEQLGIEIRDVNGAVKSTEVLFDEITAQLQDVETDSQRAAFAAQLFGDDFGPKLVPLLNQGVEGIRAARQELRDLGFVISESEAAGVERMNDAITKASRVTDGLAKKFTVALAPAIEAIAMEFIEAAKESEGFGEEVDTVADGVIDAIGFVLDAVDSVGRSFKIVSRVGIIAFESLKVIVIELADTIINGPTEATNQLIQLLNKLPGIDIDYRFAEIAPGLKNDLVLSESIISQALTDINEILLEPLPSSALEKRVARIRDELASFKQEVNNSGPLLEAFDIEAITGQKYDRDKIDKTGPTTAMRERNALEQEYLGLIRSTRTAAEAHNEQITRVDELYIAGVIPTAEEYADILDRINDKFEGTTEKVSELDQFTLQAARNMQSQFADFLFDPFDEGVSGMLKGFSETLRRMAAEAASAAIMNSIFGGFGGGGGPSGGGFAAFLGSIFGGGRDQGGRGVPGKVYEIGVGAQPELFMPDTPGTFIPANQLPMAGGTTNINVHLPPQIARHTANQVATEVSRVQNRASSRNR